MKNLWSILLVAGLAFGCGSESESDTSAPEETAETTAEVTEEGDDEAEGDEAEAQAEPSEEAATEADFEVAAIDEITPDNLEEHVQRLEAAVAEDLGDDDEAIAGAEAGE